MISKDKIKFIAKVTIAHFITYMLCGTLFEVIFNYQAYIEVVGMKSADEINVHMVMLGQIVRGILFGIVIWWIKDSIIGKKLAWLKLWVILVILGIISVYDIAPFSIEGYLYLRPYAEPLPLSFHIGSNLEIILQSLLFSIIVTFQKKKRLETRTE